MDMIQQQIERRRKRGEEELQRIVNRGHHPIYSTFEVTSISGRTYRVRIHDLEELHNTCTCPDYRTNLIGTCKHIEGVLIQLRDRYGDELAKLAADRPAVTRIYLHYAQDVTVRVSQPLPKSAALQKLLNRYFDAEGVLQGPILRTHPAEASVDPAFEVLDEGRAAALRAQAVESALLWAANDPEAVTLFPLLTENGLRQAVSTLLGNRLDAAAALRQGFDPSTGSGRRRLSPAAQDSACRRAEVQVSTTSCVSTPWKLA